MWTVMCLCCRQLQVSSRPEWLQARLAARERGRTRKSITRWRLKLMCHLYVLVCLSPVVITANVLTMQWMYVSFVHNIQVWLLFEVCALRVCISSVCVCMCTWSAVLFEHRLAQIWNRQRWRRSTAIPMLHMSRVICEPSHHKVSSSLIIIIIIIIITTLFQSQSNRYEGQQVHIIYTEPVLARRPEQPVTNNKV